MKERDKTKRIVICCKDMKTTNMLGVMVSELGEKATVLHSGQDMSETRSINERWLDSPVSPLVASDTTLPSLSTVGADLHDLLSQILPANQQLKYSS